MFVNPWLAEWRESVPSKPGVYPSGGPMPHRQDI